MEERKRYKSKRTRGIEGGSVEESGVEEGSVEEAGEEVEKGSARKERESRS